MEACLEVLLELCFCTKPPNFGAEAHIEVVAVVALTTLKRTLISGHNCGKGGEIFGEGRVFRQR
jgi:hypothetical protein